MKKIAFILFFLGFILFCKSTYAIYFTDNLVKKAHLKEGIKMQICPVNVSYNSSDVILNSNDDNLSKNLDIYYKDAYSKECAGETKSLISATLTYTLINDKSKDDYVYIFNDLIYRGDEMVIATYDMPNNDPGETSFDENTLDYILARKLFNVDPSLPYGGIEESSGSGVIWHYTDWNKLFGGNFISENASRSSLPLFIFDNVVYRLDSVEKELKDVTLLEYPDSGKTVTNAPNFEEDLKDFSKLVYPSSEFIGKKHISCTDGGNEESGNCDLDQYNYQTIEERDKILKFYEDLQNNLGDYCEISGSLEKFEIFKVKCIKNNLKTIATIENKEDLVYEIIVSNFIFEKEEEIIDEINGFPVYPGAIFMNKKSLDKKCQDSIVYSNCNSDVYFWKTNDDEKKISDWFLKNIDDTGWKCNDNSYDDYSIATTVCKNNSFEYGLSISTKDNLEGNIILYIPNGEKVESRPHAMPQNSSLWSDIPLYSGINFSNPVNNPECNHIDQDPLNCSKTTRTGSINGDKRSEIRDWYVKNKSSWICKDSGLSSEKKDEFTYFTVYCNKKINGDEEVRGNIDIALDNSHKNTIVTIGVDYKEPDLFLNH